MSFCLQVRNQSGFEVGLKPVNMDVDGCFVTLQVNNYALSLHLKKAQEQDSMPGRFHRDVF